MRRLGRVVVYSKPDEYRSPDGHGICDHDHVLVAWLTPIMWVTVKLQGLQTAGITFYYIISRRVKLTLITEFPC